MAGIEKLLNFLEWSKDTDLTTYVIVDFMSKIRQMPSGAIDTIGEAIHAVHNASASVSCNIESIHFIYDSYVELCLKKACRFRRYDPADSIEVIGMNEQSPIPKQLNKFWSSGSNKETVQLLSRKLNYPSFIFGSMVVNSELIPAMNADQEIDELNYWIEEGKMGIPPHIDWAIRNRNIERFVILSNDTDGFAYLCEFIPHFISMGV